MKPTSYIDHTLLKPTATDNQIDQLCAEAIRLETASVCVPPCYVKYIKERHGDTLPVCTVIGFPLGYATTEAKLAEAHQALADGADELDMVINISDIKNGRDENATAEIRQMKQLAGDKTVKVIVETCYLTEAEKIRCCEIVSAAGADYIKTSTGFGPEGAKLEDIELFKRHLAPGVKIKAAGGIRTREALDAFIAAGCERVGMSATAKLFADDLD